MKQATHKHRSKDFSYFEYLVTEKGVFILTGDEWIKSSVELASLLPIHEAKLEHENKVLIGEHCTSGELIIFANLAKAVESGFAAGSINRCLDETQNTHKGYKWRLAA